MSKSTVKNLPKSTVEIEIIIPWDEIKSTYDTVFEEIAKETEVPGFRKGKAPKNLLEKKLDKTKIYEEVIKRIVPKAYQEAISINNLKPVTSPKIEVLKAKENEDWLIKATLALKPKINLKNYKEKIREFKKSKIKIWTPGQDEKKEEEKKPSLDELLKVLLDSVEIELSDLLIQEEANRLLAQLIDQTQKLGLTVEQYLMAKGKTTEQIRAEYAQAARTNLTTEFVLAEIADSEKIVVTDEDFNKILAKIEKPEEREKIKKDSYYLAHLIRQQKTLDFLNSL